MSFAPSSSRLSYRDAPEIIHRAGQTVSARSLGTQSSSAFPT